MGSEPDKEQLFTSSTSRCGTKSQLRSMRPVIPRLFRSTIDATMMSSSSPTSGTDGITPTRPLFARFTWSDATPSPLHVTPVQVQKFMEVHHVASSAKASRRARRNMRVAASCAGVKNGTGRSHSAASLDDSTLTELTAVVDDDEEEEEDKTSPAPLSALLLTCDVELLLLLMSL